MNQIGNYVFRQTLFPALFFVMALSGVVWLSQGLKMLDVVVNRGQSLLSFLMLTIYVLPSLLTLVLPISLFCAVLYALNRLYTDSEIVALFAAGVSPWTIARPILLIGLMMTAFGLVISLYLTPLGHRAMRDKVYEIRSDLAAGLFREGAITHPAKDWTVFVREVTRNGELKGIFVDGRGEHPLGTVMAESGLLVRTDQGPMLIARNGTWIRKAAEAGENPVFVQFAEDTFLLSSFIQPEGPPMRQYNDRYLPELLNPNPNVAWDVQNRGRLISEGHMRLSGPLYNLALPLIAIVALLRGRFSRRGFALRIVAGTFAAIIVQIAGIGAHSLVQAHLNLVPIHYLIPILTIAICIALLVRPHPLLRLRSAISMPDLHDAPRHISSG